MASLVMAFITEEPTPDTHSLYLDFAGNSDIADDEGAFPFDVDWYVEQGFDENNLIIRRERSSGTSFWSRFVHYDTVSVLARTAYGNGYVPDVAVIPSEYILFIHDGQHHASDYAQSLLDHPDYYVTFCMWHS